MTIEAEQPSPEFSGRSKSLKAATHAAHEKLDKFIIGANPFADRGSYGQFLAMQYRFHRDLEALFNDSRLADLLPDLAERSRLQLIEQDHADLGLTLPPVEQAPSFQDSQGADLPYALGWLYVIEGSNLGAAFLLKYAGKLGLNGYFGARHLAGAPQGRGVHWRTFTQALDAIELSKDDEDRMVEGAIHAFEHVNRLAHQSFAQDTAA